MYIDENRAAKRELYQRDFEENRAAKWVLELPTKFLVDNVFVYL